MDRPRPPASAPLTKADLSTPALIVDLDLLEANIAALAAHARGAGCHLRPHAKTHKCPAIARMQVAAGARGIAVATVAEAEAMVAAGLPGVLLTSPIADAGKVGRMVDLARAGGDVLLAVGHAHQAQLMAEAAEAAGVGVDVLIDLDMGDRRFGIAPGAPALDLARLIGRSPSLRIRGVQAYYGYAAHVAGFDARRATTRAALARAVDTFEALKRAGVPVEFLSCGSTGTYNIDSDLSVPVELQSGSYVFMDNEYRSVGAPGSETYADFHRALTVLATVVSAHHADRVTVDAGVKSFASDTPFRPEPKGRPGLAYEFHGDEFGRLTADPGTDLPRLGDRIEFYPPHCDPTVNLYDRIHATRGDRVEAVWPILARKEFLPLPGS